MHKIFDLKEMEMEQLQALASELGLKGFKRMDKEALIYAIIDEEAIRNSVNVPEKSAKKRGRPKKNDKQAAQPQEVKKNNPIENNNQIEKEVPAAKEAKSEAEITSDQGTPQPKKRGRKP